MTTSFARIAGLCCGLMLLAGCAGFRTADNELDAASHKLATENTTLTSHDRNAPEAVITPQGDFLIDGKRVAITPQQRNEMLAYRTQTIEIAQQGIAIGHEGVEAGRRAVVPMIFAALFGADDDAVEASMDKRLAGVRKDSEQLCTRLPQLMATQQQLAAELPAFKPYATLTRKDVEDCRTNVADSFDMASSADHDR
jgi:hypothetical protein